MNEAVLDNWLELLKKMPSLFIGLFLFALGLVANLYSRLGMGPWAVLTVGMVNQTPFTFGQASQLIGLVVLAIGWALGFAPGLATLANMYFVGVFIDQIMIWGLLPTPGSLLEQFAMLFLSIALIGVASLLYLRVRLGAGPRDGLMMGLVRRLDRPVSHVRGTLEVTVLVIGYLLGGPVGIGTVINAFCLGISVQLAFKIGRYDRKAEHIDIFGLLNSLSGKGSLS